MGGNERRSTAAVPSMFAHFPLVCREVRIFVERLYRASVLNRDTIHLHEANVLHFEKPLAGRMAAGVRREAESLQRLGGRDVVPR